MAYAIAACITQSIHLSDLRQLLYGALSLEGDGVDLSGWLDFITAGFGCAAPEAALDQGYVQATVVHHTDDAWFHWPADVPYSLRAGTNQAIGTPTLLAG